MFDDIANEMAAKQAKLDKSLVDDGIANAKAGASTHLVNSVGKIDRYIRTHCYDAFELIPATQSPLDNENDSCIMERAARNSS